MTRRKSILGALVLCALSLCAFGAANASATGLTAYTCKEVTPKTGEFTDAHCETPGEGNFSTVVIPEKQLTAVTGTATGNSTLSAVIGGVKFQVICSAMMTLSGNVENVTTSGTMEVLGTNAVLDYTGCKGHVGTKECKITGNGNEGTIRTSALKSRTSFSAEGHFVTFEPETGTTFTEFTVGNECGKAFEGVKTVSGSAKGTMPENPDSHITFTGTAGGHLLLGAISAEYEGTNHLTMVEGETEHTIGVKTS